MTDPGLGTGRGASQTALGTTMDQNRRGRCLGYFKKRVESMDDKPNRGGGCRNYTLLSMKPKDPSDVYAAYHGMGWYVMM